MLLLEMVVAFGYDIVPLLELFCEPDDEYMGGPSSCLVYW